MDMKKLFVAFIFLLALCLCLGGVYFLTQDLPVYDRFYDSQERSERDLKRIRLSLPQEIGEYSLQASQKGSDVIQVYEGCYDAYGQGAVDETTAVLCEREITAQYRSSTNDRVMAVGFVSVAKGLDDYLFRMRESLDASVLEGHKVFRFKGETDNQILWYPENKRNPFLQSVGWYTEKPFTAISVQQSKIVSTSDGEKNNDFTETIDTTSPVISYFLEAHPPE